MDVINKSLSALFLLIFLTAYESSFAQNRSAAPANQQVQFYFDKPITLDSLTKYVHSRSKIRFSFNSSKVKGSKLIDLKKGVYSIEQLLQQIRKNTSLYYSMYNGYVIFQDNPPKQKSSTPPAAKPNNTKPPMHKAAIVSHQDPAPKQTNKNNTQQPARQIKTEPTARAPQIDTAKIKTDSIPVFVSGKPPVQTSDIPDDTSDTRNRLTLRWPKLQLGVVPVDTTTIDTLQKKDTPNIDKPTATPATKQKKERTAITAAKSKIYYDTEGSSWSWQFGLQWKGAIPLYETKNYFTGTDTRQQPYNLLIPGAWVSLTANGRHEIMLLVKPAEWYYYNKKNFRTDTGYVVKQRIDSVVHKDSIKASMIDRLLKTSGWYGSLQYNFHINENLMIGAGIGCHLLGQGLAHRLSNKIASDSLVADSLFTLRKTDTTQYLSSSFISGKLEIAYKLKAFDLGATLLMPLTDPFTDKSLNKSRPVNLQLFVRWRIKRNEDD